MKLAQRTKWLSPEGAYLMLSKAQELERRGKSIIHFEIGQPDFATPASIVTAGTNALESGKTKYTSSLGIIALRTALANYITKTRKIQTSPEQIAVVPGAKTALFAAIAAVVNPSDEVLYPDPGFPSYKILTEFFGGRAIPIPLTEQNNFSFDLNELKKKFTKKTKLLILNSPNNPTGGIVPKQDMQEIAELIHGTSCWILSDEIYSRLLYTDKPFVSIYSEPDMAERTLLVEGFSKTYAMTGWRLGYLVFPKSLQNKIDYLITHVVSCTAQFTQEAGLSAVMSAEKSVQKMIIEYKKRRDLLIKLLNQLPGITCQQPGGAFYVFPNITGTRLSSNQFAELMLEKAGVALLPGTSFGKYGEGYARICYANSQKNIIEGINRMKNILQQQKHRS